MKNKKTLLMKNEASEMSNILTADMNELKHQIQDMDNFGGSI